MQQLAAAAQHDGARNDHRMKAGWGAWAPGPRTTAGRSSIAWCGVVLILGALAPFADRALSGAGWEAVDRIPSGRPSRARSTFPGARHLRALGSGRRPGDALFSAPRARARAILRSDPAVSGVLRVAGSLATAARRSSSAWRARHRARWLKAAGRLEARLVRLSSPGVAVRLTETAAMWSDFNATNKEAMLKSEALSWPLTLALLVLAFGTLVAAGLPLLLTMAGLLGAGGLLFVCGQFADVSIWAMNFAMMFAIALGIDYALFIVVRFRSALAAGLHRATRRPSRWRPRARRC